MINIQLEKIINEKLNILNFNDYTPNGLQVEGASEITTVVTGVSACQMLLNEAVKRRSNAILVHHGYFWKNESSIIKGIKRQRLHTLLSNNINLYAWHLPLDAHPEFGNNVQLAHLLGIKIKGNILPFLAWGQINPMSGEKLSEIITKRLNRSPLHYSDNAPKIIKNIAWCSGAGQKLIDDAAEFGVDAFITGEVSEATIHSAREYGIHFFSAGHHATERAGIQALGEWLSNNYNLNVTFIDIKNFA